MKIHAGIIRSTWGKYSKHFPLDSQLSLSILPSESLVPELLVDITNMATLIVVLHFCFVLNVDVNLNSRTLSRFYVVIFRNFQHYWEVD